MQDDDSQQQQTQQQSRTFNPICVIKGVIIIASPTCAVDRVLVVAKIPMVIIIIVITVRLVTEYGKNFLEIKFDKNKAPDKPIAVNPIGAGNFHRYATIPMMRMAIEMIPEIFGKKLPDAMLLR